MSDVDSNERGDGVFAALSAQMSQSRPAKAALRRGPAWLAPGQSAPAHADEVHDVSEASHDEPDQHDDAAWGPEAWPQLVRENLDSWPPTFRERQLVDAVRVPRTAPRRVAIISGKDGVGKTALAQLLRSIFALHRDGDTAVVLDANPTAPAPGQVVEASTPHSGRGVDVKATGRVVDGVVQLVGRNGQATTVAPPPGDSDHGRLATLLAKHYGVVLCDAGSALGRDALGQILDNCDQIVVVATPRLDGVYAATACLADVRAAGYEGLAANAVVALNRIRRMPFSDLVNIDRHFKRIAGTVVRIPWDPRLEQEGIPSLDELRPSARTGLYELAAAVAQCFGAVAVETPREERITG